MFNFQLLSYLPPDFQSLNLEDDAVLIRLEKTLKAEAKLNPEIQSSEMEVFLYLLKNNSFFVKRILENKPLLSILGGEDSMLRKTPFLDVEFDQYANLFETYFLENINLAIDKQINHADWGNLSTLFKNYPFLFGLNALDHLQSRLTNNIDFALDFFYTSNQDYQLTRTRCAYILDPSFYSMLSQIDSTFFKPQIGKLTSCSVSIGNPIPLTDNRKQIFGELFIALGSFETSNPTFRKLLNDNRSIGKAWVSKIAEIKKRKSRKTPLFLMILLPIIISIPLILRPPHAPKSQKMGDLLNLKSNPQEGEANLLAIIESGQDSLPLKINHDWTYLTKDSLWMNDEVQSVMKLNSKGTSVSCLIMNGIWDLDHLGFRKVSSFGLDELHKQEVSTSFRSSESSKFIIDASKALNKSIVSYDTKGVNGDMELVNFFRGNTVLSFYESDKYIASIELIFIKNKLYYGVGEILTITKKQGSTKVASSNIRTIALITLNL